RNCFGLGSERLPFWVGEGFIQSCFHGRKTLPFALHDAGIYTMSPSEGAVVPFGRKSVLSLDCIVLVVDSLNLTPLAETNFGNVSLQNFHGAFLSVLSVRASVACSPE